MMFDSRAGRLYNILVTCLIVSSFLFYGATLTLGSSPSSGDEAVHSVSEGEHGSDGHGGSDRSGDLKDLLGRFINFTLLVVILVVVIKKTPVKDILSNRSKEIRQKLEDLQREKEEAETKYKDIESQLRDFEEKRKDILDRFVKEGLVEKDKIISEAKDKVNQIIEQSELTIQQEIQATRDRLKQEVVDLAAQKAQEIIVKEMNEKDQDQLVDEFLERVGKIH